MTNRISPFLNAGDVAAADALAILQLQRAALVPVTIKGAHVASEDYVEGIVTNTRFGSFPHSTLVDQPWGSQIRASKVDTGSKGKVKKRKRDPDDDGEEARDSTPVKTAITAGTGFAHLLPPTPESWTISLPHRTQVVYTPDYSYVLQRLRVLPGQRIIEAGAGSGSFTHASVRAVFNGYPSATDSSPSNAAKGHVYSFEYHEPRVGTLREELVSHGLSDIVTVTHRDVYENGFLLEDGSSPCTNAVFLDLPAPWKALRHLTRRKLSSQVFKALAEGQTPSFGSDTIFDGGSSEQDFVSPLDPQSATSVCAFIPCIEQVQSAVAALRALGWVDINMVEIVHRRFEVRRERVGLAEEGLRGTNSGPKDVEETMARLMEVEGRFKAWGEIVKRKSEIIAEQGGQAKDQATTEDDKAQRKTQKQQRQERNREVEKARKIYKEGILVSRPEAEIKTHTSYLVFAVLPVEWTEADEKAALAQWGTGIKAKDKPSAPPAAPGDAAAGEGSEEI